MAAFAGVLPFAVAVAICVIPLIAVILLLFGPRGQRCGLAFLAGWAVGLGVALVVVMLVSNSPLLGGQAALSARAYWLEVALGVLLVLAAIRELRHGSRGDTTVSMPKWMGQIDSFTAPRAFGLAFVLAALSPKNLALELAATLDIIRLTQDEAQVIFAAAAFVMIGSLTIAAPVCYYLFATEKADRRLGEWKAWLIKHNSAVMGVLLVVMGALLLSKGLVALLS